MKTQNSRPRRSGFLTCQTPLSTLERAPENSVGKQLIEHPLSGCFAIVFAAIPAWIASHFMDKQAALFVFSAMIVFYGCLEISCAVARQLLATSKMLD